MHDFLRNTWLMRWCAAMCVALVVIGVELIRLHVRVKRKGEWL